jgi:hypothetical protein
MAVMRGAFTGTHLTTIKRPPAASTPVPHAD